MEDIHIVTQFIFMILVWYMNEMDKNKWIGVIDNDARTPFYVLYNIQSVRLKVCNFTES